MLRLCILKMGNFGSRVICRQTICRQTICRQTICRQTICSQTICCHFQCRATGCRQTNCRFYNMLPSPKCRPTKCRLFITLVPSGCQNGVAAFLLTSGPDFFTSVLFLRLKLGLPIGLAGAEGPIRPQAWLTQLATPILTLKKRSW
jgi:hypothetical protein